MYSNHFMIVNAIQCHFFAMAIFPCVPGVPTIHRFKAASPLSRRFPFFSAASWKSKSEMEDL